MSETSTSRRLVLNTIANGGGQLLGPLVSILLVPIYLRVLGREAYGLIGFFSALSILLSVFSHGVGQSLQREIARRERDPAQRGTRRNLVRTFEIAYAALGLLLALALAAFSSRLAHGWVRATDLDPALIQTCLLLLALRIGVALPNGVYQAVFIGTQRQVTGNLIIMAATFAGAVATVVVVLIFRSIVAVLVVDAALAALTLVALRMGAAAVLAEDDGPPGRFSWVDFTAVARPSAWIIWSSGIGVIVTQTDRVLLSRMVELSSLAAYNTAVAGGRLISVLYTPFLVAAYPELCQLSGAHDRPRLTRLMARNAAVVAALTCACTAPLGAFAPDVLLAWTHDAALAREGALVLTIYVAGSVAIAYASVFYSLMLALGAVRFAALFNTLSLFWYPVGMAALIRQLGIAGAAWTWLAYAVSAWITVVGACYYRHLERSGLLPYLLRSLAAPLVGLLFSLLARQAALALFPGSLVGRLLCALAAAAAILPVTLTIGLGPRACRDLLRRALHRKVAA